MAEREDSDVPEHLLDLVQHLPQDWDNPLEIVTSLVMEQSGILPQMAQRNSELTPRLTDFFVGRKDTQFIVGESGMGKSLMVGDLRRMHDDLNHLVPPVLRTQLCVIAWDRTHKLFFTELELEAGVDIPLPKGETPIEGRRIVSNVLLDQLRFAKTYYPKNTKILVEVPFIGSRGENILEGVNEFAPSSQVFVMDSPASRYETLNEERISTSSGQHDAMREIRRSVLAGHIGMGSHRLNEDEQNEAMRRMWEERLARWDGIVVEWDPSDDRAGYNYTIEQLKASNLKPDEIVPSRLGRYALNQYESIMETIVDKDSFIRKMTS